MSLTYIKKDIDTLLTDIQKQLYEPRKDLNYKELIKIQVHLTEVKFIIGGIFK